MFKLLEFFRLLSIGFGIVDAWRFNHVKIKSYEKLIVTVLAISLLVNYTVHKYHFHVTQISQIKREHYFQQINYARIQAFLLNQIEQKEKTVINYELAFISCLNNNGIVVNRRSMNCTIKDYY